MSTRAPTTASANSGPDPVIGAAIGAIFGGIIVGVCILICIVKIQRKLHRNKVAPLDASTLDYHGKNSLERGSLSALPTTSNIPAQQPPSSHIIDMTKDGNGLSDHTTQKLLAERAKHPSIMLQGVPSPLIPPQHRDSTQFENVGFARRESEDQHRIHNAAVYAQQQRMMAAQKKKIIMTGNIPESVQESPRSLVLTEHSHPIIADVIPRQAESSSRRHSTERAPPKPRAEKNVIAVIRPGGNTPRSSEIHIVSTPRENDIQTTTTTSSPKTTDSVTHDTPTIFPLSPVAQTRNAPSITPLSPTVAQTPRGRRVVTALAVADDDVTE